MRWRSELVLYLATFVLFGAVLLWADEATWPVVVLFGVLAVLLLATFAWRTARVPRVLVVGMDSEELEELDDALEFAGYDVCTCAGPANRPCPVFQGQPCPIAERPVAALIYRPAGSTGRYAPCGRALRVPSMIVEQHLEDEPAVVGTTARVGLDRGPDRVVRTMEDLLAA
ncbi:MAG TPA: hypothetical protein VE669_00800 [Actinomycetota bacterium]|jgi:hypothetical protein|nr:hypothetical protein [Actinomycetota bacterium]